MNTPAVLVSDGKSANSRDAVVAIRALATAGYRVAATVALPSRFAAASRYVDQKLPVPPVDDPQFKARIVELVQSEDFCGLIPASESVTLAMEPHGSELMNKVTLHQRATEVGLDVMPSAEFESFEDLKAHAEDLDFPVVVKPVIRSFNAVRVENHSGLQGLDIESVPLIVQSFVPGQMEAISGVMWRGEVHSVVQESWERIWPRDCGLAAAATTMEVSGDMVTRLGRLMNGYEGLFSAQFLSNKLLDLNLRVHSSLPLAVMAGANLVSIYADLLQGGDPPRLEALPGYKFRWISGELRGIVTDWRAGDMSLVGAAKTLIPRPHTAHSMFSVKDPIPFLIRLGDHV